MRATQWPGPICLRDKAGGFVTPLILASRGAALRGLSDSLFLSEVVNSLHYTQADKPRTGTSGMVAIAPARRNFDGAQGARCSAGRDDKEDLDGDRDST